MKDDERGDGAELAMAFGLILALVAIVAASIGVAALMDWMGWGP